VRTRPTVLYYSPAGRSVPEFVTQWVDGTGLTVYQRFDAVMAVLNYVRGDAHVTAVLLGGEPPVLAEYAGLIRRFVRAERFPVLAAAVAEGLFDPDPADADASRSFEFGLERILDGCQRIIDNS